MKRGALFFLFISVITIAVVDPLFSCLHQAAAEKNTTIRLRWVKAFPAEDWNNVETGIYWSLSYMGASLDTAMRKSIIVREDSTHFTLDLEKAGFDSVALSVFDVVITALKNSEEYARFNCVDLARFLVLTEHSSAQYYAITGAAPTLEEFRKRHPGFSSAKFNLYKSGVALHHRNIEFRVGANAMDMAWIATEGTGNSDSGTFVPTAYEVLDMMKNGQLRFAVYGKDGKLIPASPVEDGAAGKPSKCLWCHEIVVQPLYYASPEPQKGISVEQFGALVDSSQHMVDAYRGTLHSIIDFSQRQAHTQGELLYISFMEPSYYRLANEWMSDSTSARKRTGIIATHVYAEFPYLGNSVYRSHADSVCGFGVVHVPLSVREPNDGEPDLLKVGEK